MESTMVGDSVKGDRIVVEYEKCDRFKIISGSSKDKRQRTNFEGDEVCCTITRAIKRKIFPLKK